MLQLPTADGLLGHHHMDDMDEGTGGEHSDHMGGAEGDDDHTDNG